MALPHSLQGKYTSERPVSEYPDSSPQHLAHEFANKLKTGHFSQVGIEGGIVRFQSKASLFNIPYHGEVRFERTGHFRAFYTLHLVHVIFVTVAVLLFAAFFSQFTLTHFIWFSVIFTVVFYSANVGFIANTIRRKIKTVAAFAPYDFNTAEKLSREQQQWIRSKDHCPACGHEVSPYHTHCPDCGLKLPGKRKKSPANSTTPSKNIIYEYKPPSGKNRKH